MKTITKFIIGLVITAHQVYGLLDVQGCDVGTTYENSTLREFVMNQFTKNVPKQDELLRTKLYFNAKSPAISIAEKDKQLVFGYNHKTPGEFGIFMTHEDWMDATNPCHAKLKKDVFSEDFYTELDVVLKKDGRFFIIVYGNNAFALMCETSLEFTTDFKTLIGYAGNKGKHTFFYDCPMRNI